MIARPVDVLVQAREPDESRATVGNGTDDATQSRMPAIDFARNDRSHREARRGMPGRERYVWSIIHVEAAAKLEVVCVTHIHVRERSSEETLAEPGQARRKENRFCDVDTGVRQSGRS